MTLRLPSRRSSRLRFVAYSVLALSAFGAALILLLSSTLLAPPLPLYAAKRTIPLTDVNPYGANFFLEREVEAWKREHTVSMARAAGIGWARQEFPWEEIEPSKGEFNWGKYDDLVALCQNNGLQIIARLDRPPLWARANASGTGSSGPPDDYATYGDFVEAFARHYQGKIYFFQIWNEPNLAREWNDGPIDPAAYTSLLKTAYQRAKSVDPNIRILTAPLAITLGELYSPDSASYRNMNDLQFLEEMYLAGGKDYFDILSANAFGLGSPPEDPPNPGKLNFQRVVLERAVMERSGDSNKTIWINEFGWDAPPDTIPDSRLVWGRVTEQQQADYTVRGIEYARKNWPWVGVISIWFFRQVGDYTLNNPESYFRMVDVDFTPRPVYLRLAQMASGSAKAGPGEYQATNPALAYSGQWSPVFDKRDNDGQEMISNSPDARVKVSFWGDGLDLVVHRGPGLGRFVATLDGLPVQGLPLDPGKKSYIDLSAPEDKWQVVVPVARGLVQGDHVLELTGSGNVNLDGFTVPRVAPAEPPWAAIGALSTVALLAFYMLARERQKRN